ncbi:MAG: hypothetical protein ABGX05_09625 [Pirellulaceae bacterium]
MKSFLSAAVVAAGLLFAPPAQAETFAQPVNCDSDTSTDERKVPAKENYEFYWGIFVDPTINFAQSFDVDWTEEQLAACAGTKLDFDRYIAIQSYEPNPSVPPDPKQGWTCQITKPDGTCWKFTLTFEGDIPFDLRNLNPGQETQKPQLCTTTTMNAVEGLVRYNSSPQARCWMQGLWKYPDSFGTHTTIIDAERRNALASIPGVVESSIWLTVNIKEKPTDPEPIGPEQPGPVEIDYQNNDFGDVDVFTAKKQTVEITNLSETAVDVNKIRIKHDDEDQWLKVKEDAGCERLAWPNTCKVKVQFFPRNDGPQAAVLDVDLDADYELSIPLTGFGVEPVAEEGKRPAAPKKPTVPSTPSQEVDEVSPGKYVVDTNKNKVKIKFVPPGGSSAYEWRKKYLPKGKWSKWKGIDPEPNKKGFVVFDVPMKKSGCYRVQLRGVNAAGKSERRTITVCKEVPVVPGNG